MKSKILGVSGGNGVILHPFKDNLVANIEVRPIFSTPNRAQWKLNFVAPMDSNSDSTYGGNIDVIIGAPDCGHSSALSYSRAKRLSNPKDNKSLQVYVEQIQKYKPKVFLMENLPKAWDTLKDLMPQWLPEYEFIPIIGSVSMFGNSQTNRIRLVLIGFKKEFPSFGQYFDVPFSLKNNIKEEGLLLQGLGPEPIPKLCHVREPDNYQVHMFYKGEKKITVAKARQLWNTEYKHLRKWPVNNGNLVNQPGVYRNFKDDYPLTVRKQNRQFNSDGYMLSPREIARIQNVPDSFKLWYTEVTPLYCINKARATVAKTPPYDIGVWFHKIISKIEQSYI